MVKTFLKKIYPVFVLVLIAVLCTAFVTGTRAATDYEQEMDASSYAVFSLRGGQYYRLLFKPEKSARYTLTSAGLLDTMVELYDYSTGQLISSNDDGGESRNFSLTESLVAGKSYLYKVRLYSSSSSGTVAVNLSGSYTDGTVVAFGSYPQSRVTDSSLLSALNSKSLTWKSYPYYSGNGSYGSMTQSSSMKYSDVTYNGTKYRAVKFSKFRPHHSFRSEFTDNSDSVQYSNGYNLNTVYWFEYDPVIWYIVDSDNNYLLSAVSLDAQPFNNAIYSSNNSYWMNSSATVFANDYYNSSIRSWLNGTFYNTAFGSSETSAIETASLDNSAFSELYSKYNSTSSNDKVFLPSYAEVNGSSEFYSGVGKYTFGSEYAKSQGLISNDWRLRTAGRDSELVCCVDADGEAQFNYYSYFNGAIRPAIKATLSCSALGHLYLSETVEPTCEYGGYTFDVCVQCAKVQNIQSSGSAKGHTYSWVTTKAATCSVEGSRKQVCSVCKAEGKTESIAKTAHSYNWVTVRNATCSVEGSRKQVCSVCRAEGKTESIAKTAHNYGWVTVRNATCSAEGSRKQVCSVCKAEGKTESIAKTAHNYNWVTARNATCSAEGSRKQVCSVCNAEGKTESIAKTAHSYKWTITQKATCTKTGVQKQVCSVCKAVGSQKSISKVSHKYKAKDTVKAGLNKDGYIKKQCSMCKSTVKTTIYRIKSVKPSYDKTEYSGNAKTPTVTVKDRAGNRLKNGSDYSVSYSGKRKEIGTYKVVVKFKGKYSGTKQLSFKIVLGKVSKIKQIEGQETRFAWSKVYGADGYEVYKYNSKSKKYEKLYVTKHNSLYGGKISRDMKILVRAYRKVGKKTYYGDWSKTLTLKAK